MSLFGPSLVLGLDVGSSMLKAVGLRRRGDKVFAERAGIAAMPAGAFSGAVFLDPPAVSDCVRKLCRQQRLGGKRVVTAVAGEGVFLTRLKLARAPDQPLEAQLCEEVAHLLPFPLEQASLDFQVLDNFSEAQWVHVLVVAAKREKVDRLWEVLWGAGKAPVVVDSTACALANAFEFNYEPGPSEVAALLHLGAATMTVCIVRGSTPLVAQDLPLRPAPFPEEEWSLTDRIAVHLERVFELLDEIADEHPLEPRSSQIERIILSGGGARLQGLEEVLHSRTQLPLEEMNPFRRIEFKSSGAISRLVWNNAHCMPVAVGLALRGLEQL